MNEKFKNNPAVRQSAFTIHYALPYFDRLHEILSANDVSLSDAELDEIILGSLIHQLRHNDRRALQKELVRALVEELETYNGDYLPRNIEQQIADKALLLFSLQPESLASTARQCSNFGCTDHDEIDPYITDEIQQHLEQTIPADTELKITISCSNRQTDEPYAEATSRNLADSLSLFLDAIENGGETITRLNTED